MPRLNLDGCLGRAPEYDPAEPYPTFYLAELIVAHPKKLMAAVMAFCLLVSFVTMAVHPINIVTAGDTFRYGPPPSSSLPRAVFVTPASPSSRTAW